MSLAIGTIIKEVTEKNRIYYELYAMPLTANISEDYCHFGLVCTKPDGSYTSPKQVVSMYPTVAKKINRLEEFHFHCLRHSNTMNMLANGAAPKLIRAKTREMLLNSPSYYFI